MTTDELAVKFKKIFELKKQIKNLQVERSNAEKVLVEKYKVIECNQERDALSASYQSQIKTLAEQVYAIEDELGG